MKSLYSNGGFIGRVQSYTNLEPYVTATPATITFVAARSGNLAGSTTVGQTLNITSMGLLYGDILIVAYETCGTVNKTLSISGYTTISDLYANSTEDSNLLVAFKFMGVVPDTQIIIPPTQNAADAGAYVLHAYRGVNLTTPLDVVSTTSSTTTSAIPDPAAITPVTSGALIVVAAGAAHTTGTGVFTASYLSNFTTNAGNGTNDATVGMGDVVWPGGSYNPAAWTFTGTNSTAFSTNSVTMALRPGFVMGNRKNSGVWNIKAEYRSKSFGPSAGQVTFNTPGTVNYTVPVGVNTISALCIGGGGGGGARGGNNDEAGAGGGGGGLAYSTFLVAPGETLTVTVGAGGLGGQATAAAGAVGGTSQILRGATPLVQATGGGGGGGGNGGATPSGGAGGVASIGAGGSGGIGGTGTDGGGVTGLRGGGGGAGGYSGFGGVGANNGATTGGSGNGGGGGGGGGTSTGTTTGGGGGVGVFGQVSNGVGGTATVNATGGSGGASATYAGGLFGGGGSGGGSATRTNAGAGGAVRIIWGPFTFPSNAPSNITGQSVEYGILGPRYIEYY